MFIIVFTTSLHPDTAPEAWDQWDKQADILLDVMDSSPCKYYTIITDFNGFPDTNQNLMACLER